MRRLVFPLATLVLVGLLAPASGVLAQIVSPQSGEELPSSYYEVLRQDPQAFQMRHAWIQKSEQARELREQALAEGSFKAAEKWKVSGSYSIPVFTAIFTDTGGVPYPAADLDAQLFGPSPGSYDLTEYYSEISYGAINTQGQVFDWVALPNEEAYYSGGTNGLDPSAAKIGELIKSCLDANDFSVDFGIYDNDGPDGTPNSGDDDGFVDFVAFVHPEFGAECAGADDHIWSHRWVYRAWDASAGMPYHTDDISANGGVILIDDYTIQPALSCASGNPVIEIGVFCHEFGHGFGLPDLYDTNGGSSGLGHWGLMGSGNWNRPATPAHMSAWSKCELGWIMPIEIGWQGAVLDIPPVATHPIAYKLSFTDDRWTRRGDCPIDGEFSLVLGSTDEEASARGWAAGMGYGNRWRETIVHDFHSNGQSQVQLSFEWSKDTESAYDYAFCYFEKDGLETLLQAYDGVGTGSNVFNLTPLLGAAPTEYRIKYRFVSDTGASDEDGQHDAVCAAFIVDNISVSGGGESYLADFEEHVGGWYQPVDEVENPISESWFVENRQQMGSDTELHGEGLLIIHVDQEVAHSSLRNSGGSSNLAVHGVAIEEADAENDLADGLNRGDDGDVWPGSSYQTSFDSSSMPNSDDNSGRPTSIAVASIIANGDSMSATLTGGDPAPSLGAVLPSSHPNDVVGAEAINLEFEGVSDARHGATVTLVKEGSPDRTALVEWLDHDRLNAVINLMGIDPGIYDVVLENPDGQTAVLESGFHLLTAVAAPSAPQRPDHAALAQNYPNPFNPSTTIRFQVDRAGPVNLRVIDVRGRVVRTLVNDSREPGWYQVRWNGVDDAGQAVASGLYFYRMRTGEFEAQKKLLLVK